MQRVIAEGIEVRIEDGYPADRSTEFLRVPDRHHGVLMLWRKALHHVADAANIARRFTAGFILDDGRMALTADGDGGAVVCINPDRYREAIRKYGSEPLSLAAFLHGVACHELAHLDGRMGHGHDEEFIAAREDLGASTAHTIPQIAELAACTLGLGPCNTTPTKYEVARQEAVRACEPEVTGAEASCHAAVDPLAPMVASFVDRLLVVRPGGLSRDYIEGFAVRHEARLRAAVAGLSHEHLARGSVSRRMTPEIHAKTATVSRFVGTCQVCAAVHKLTTDTFPSLGIFGFGHKLVHHAFTRPGDGEIHGGCYAVGRPAYEESCDTTREYLERVVQPRHAAAVRYLARLISGDVTEILERSWRRGEPPTKCSVGNPTWALTLRGEISSTEHLIKSAADEMTRLGAMISDWVARPLRTIEEHEAPARAERDAAKAKRIAEHKARTEAKIASYRKRLAAAVRNRNASTIADIFDSAPRQLADRGLTRAQAFAAIGSPEVFAAFGLDPTQGCDFRTPNDDIIGAMRNGIYNAATRTWSPLVWPSISGGESAESLPSKAKPFASLNAALPSAPSSARMCYDRTGGSVDPPTPPHPGGAATSPRRLPTMLSVGRSLVCGSCTSPTRERRTGI